MVVDYALSLLPASGHSYARFHRVLLLRCAVNGFLQRGTVRRFDNCILGWCTFLFSFVRNQRICVVADEAVIKIACAFRTAAT
jgi:hypothetical protein